MAEVASAGNGAAATRERFPVITVVLGIVCVALFALGHLWTLVSFDLTLANMGVNNGDLVKDGQIWRLLSSSFLHVNVAHLIVNMIALAGFGPPLERLLGGRRYLLLYGLSALGGGLASALLQPSANSVGASGAIWGLMTGGVALALRPRGLLPPLHVAHLRARAAGPLVINFLFSFLPGISLLGHFGGGIVGALLILSGALTAGLTPQWGDAPAPPPRRAPVLTAAAAFVGLALAGSVALALAQGRPWAILGPVVLERVPLGETGLTVEVPAVMSRKPMLQPGPTYELTSFGDPARDPIVVGIITSARDQVPTDLETAVKELGEIMARTRIANAEKASRLARVELGGRTWYRLDYRIVEKRMRAYASIIGQRDVLVRIYELPDLRGGWKDIDDKIVASFR